MHHQYYDVINKNIIIELNNRNCFKKTLESRKKFIYLIFYLFI